MDKIRAIQKLKEACRLSDTYNMRGVTIYQNSKNVFIHPNMGKILNLPEVIKIGSEDYKQWQNHKVLFKNIQDFKVPEDWNQYPCLREIS